MKTTLALSNGAGWGNFGDDAIVHSIASAISRQRAPDAIANIGGPDGLQAIAGLPTTTRSYSGSAGWRDKLGAARTIAFADLLVVGGGGLLQDELPNFYRQFLRAARVAKTARVPVAVVGVGVYPPQTTEFAEQLRHLCDHAEHFSVRDQKSIDVLRALGSERQIEIVPDPAFAFPLHAEPATKSQIRHTIGVALRPWWHLPELWGAPDPSRLQALVNRVGELLSEVAAQAAVDVHIVAMHVGTADDDQAVGEALASRLRAAGVSYEIVVPGSATEAAAALAQCSAVIGMRLHSLILAATQGVPTFGLNYDAKVDNVMNLLGRREHVLELEDFDPVGAAGAVVNALSVERDPAEIDAVAQLRDRAQKELKTVGDLFGARRR